MSTESMVTQAGENTDVELWREREGDYYANSIHRTKGGGIGINVGGYVIVKPLADWHSLARTAAQPEREAVLDEVLSQHGLVLTDDPDFDHDEQTFEKAKASFVAALTTPAPVVEQIADTPGAGLISDKDGLRELGRLYNYVNDDSRQFTRWQMLIAMQHGFSLASEAALINDIFDKMAEVVAPLPGIPDAPGDAGTRAIEPSDGDEA